MSLLVDLPPEIESKVREVAAAEGLDVSALVRETMEARLRQYDPERSLTETELLARINRGFSGTFWNRYRRLNSRRRAETLTRKEQQELIGLSDQLEAWRVERLRYLNQLARLRQISVDALIKQLGLSPMPSE
jgi:post-segregation antitoxin (ccd killing protein)